MTEADRQKAYRIRKAERFDRMRAALELIGTRLAGNEKALAVELRAIVERALA